MVESVNLESLEKQLAENQWLGGYVPSITLKPIYLILYCVYLGNCPPPSTERPTNSSSPTS